MAKRSTTGGAKSGRSTGRRAASIESADTRGRTLVIVESPAKARTINRYLGDDYVVRASMGHVRDLPERDFGVDLANNFAPTYVVSEHRGQLVRQLKKMADDAEHVFLATDLDREGEAIAWHLAESLGIPADRARRVIFNQITKEAIRRAFQSPHSIDMDRVMAQQARRILDRIVGYQVSPLLWRRIRRGLSAGRVQTVAVRLIVEREREIRAFVPEEYWEIAVELNPESPAKAAAAGQALVELRAKADPEKGVSKADLYAFCEQHHLLLTDLIEVAGEKFRPGNESITQSVVAGLRSANYRVAATKTTQRQDKPYGPFTTASLQQAAINQLGMTASQAMRLAQQLYEGVELENEGSVGLITYMRTDSLNLAPEAVAAARSYVTESFGADFIPEQPNRYTAAAGAQEAHEAVRPTDVRRTPQSVRGQMDERMWRLYDLIWRRFVACQMAPARWEILTIDVRAEGGQAEKGAGTFSKQPEKEPVPFSALLRASGRKLLFEGYLAVAGRRETVEPVIPPGIVENAPLWPASIDPSQHFTEPPPRYTEASLVKMLESEGIGRPSTYAAIIDTIQARGYVTLEDRKFRPSAIGEVVCDQLVEAFPHIFDVEFTRFMESELDRIEGAHADWVTILREFYEPFSQCLAKAGESMTRPVQPSPYKCPKCQKELVYRIGRTGRFLGCTGYPDCDYTANVSDKGEPVERKQIDVKCPECGKPMMFRTSKRGPFLGCTGYPDCTSTMPCDDEGTPLKVVEPDEIKAVCPDCGGEMQVRFARGRAFMGCSKYPQCKATSQLPPGVTVRVPKSKAIETGITCDKCQRPMVVRVSRRGPFLACTGFPRCRNARNLSKAELAALERGERLAAAIPDEGTPAATPAGEEGKPKKRSAKAKAKAGGKAAPTPADDAQSEIRNLKSEIANVPAGELGDLVKAGCPTCGGPVTLRSSRFGPFLGCAKYPTCKTIVKLKGEALKGAKAQLGLPEKAAPRPKPQMTKVTCTKCGEPMVIRNGSSGQFLGCSKYPKCRNTAPLPVELTSGES
ncbi:MAG: type I DNA topoisomerase [Phycisphaerae bacterium]|nr:type I DNA topoisomerase [Phycisphaerae bacterium]